MQHQAFSAAHRAVQQGLQRSVIPPRFCATACTRGWPRRSTMAWSAAAARQKKVPPCEGRSKTMKRMPRQAVSSGCCWRVVDWACAAPTPGPQLAVQRRGRPACGKPRWRCHCCTAPGAVWAVPVAAHIVFFADPVILQGMPGRYTFASSKAGVSAACVARQSGADSANPSPDSFCGTWCGCY